MNIIDQESFVLTFQMDILKTQGSKVKIGLNLVNTTWKKPQNFIIFDRFGVFVQGIKGQSHWEFPHHSRYLLHWTSK